VDFSQTYPAAFFKLAQQLLQTYPAGIALLRRRQVPATFPRSPLLRNNPPFDSLGDWQRWGNNVQPS